ncbi:MAG TPA: diacylglycerol kinase [Cyanobacteria bacterium UBA8803]|nr:diacylglycerol kinase [Cyanobacteria bacterium UBA9273]HBL60721.1 diacylglycerol kinase [Cyanobacteria bacterium UBA8803]
MTFNKTHSSNSQLLASTSLSLPQELSMPRPNKPDPVIKTKRDLAWCIAPTLLISFKYAWAGFRYAFITQRNFRIHTIIGTLAISLGVFLHLTLVELAVIGLTSGLVMALELLNTAIESVVDLTVKQSYHELARIAKDCAAGAVLISALTSVFVAGVLLVPPLLARLQSIVQ